MSGTSDAVKPVVPGGAGVLTSEFWATISTTVVNLLAFAAALGWISLQDKASLEQMITALTGSVGVAVANATALWQYIAGRVSLKKAAAEAVTSEKIAVVTAAMASHLTTQQAADLRASMGASLGAPSPTDGMYPRS